MAFEEQGIGSDNQAPEPSKGPRPQFHMGAVEDPILSEKERRVVFKDVVFIKIFTPGDKQTVIDQPAWLDKRHRNSHVNRFPQEYAAFLAGNKTEFGTGTPLTEWPRVRPSHIETLHHFNVRSVEDLASVSDGNLENLGAGYRELRQKAIEFLAQAKEGAHAATLKAELEKRDAMLASMQEKLAALEAKADIKPKK